MGRVARSFFSALLRAVNRLLGNTGARGAVGRIQLADLTPKGDALGDALGNVAAACALIEHVDPRRYRRFQRTVHEIAVAELPAGRMRTSIENGGVLLDRALVLTYPVEAVALVLLQLSTSMRLEAAVVNRGLDTRAQVQRRVRIELLGFAGRLPNGAEWASWVEEWLGQAPTQSFQEGEERLIRDLRANNVPTWLIRFVQRIRPS